MSPLRKGIRIDREEKKRENFVRIAAFVVLVSVAIGLFYFYSGSNRTGRPRQPIVTGNATPNFELFDAEGHVHELYRYADHKAVVVFSFGVDCPIVQKSARVLGSLRDSYKKQGVAFLAVNANTADDRDKILKEAKDYNFVLPIMRDTSQMVSKQLGLRRTGEAVLIDTSSWQIVYRGGVDDRLDYGVDKGQARNEFLKDAITDVLAGRKPAVPEAKARGCAITFREDERPLDYERDIGPIISQKCLNCHSESGEIKPYFSNYEVLKSWTAMIRETVMTGRMPIWGVDSDPGEFRNDSSLTPEQKRKLVSWIDSGAPRGEGGDPLADYSPPSREIPSFSPTFAVEMDEEIEVPPNGFDSYNYYQLGGPLPRDMWVDIVEGVTSAPRAMHHATLMVTPLPLVEYQNRVNEKLKMGDVSYSPNAEAVLVPMNDAIYVDLHTRKDPKLSPKSPYLPDELIRFAVYSTYGRHNVRRSKSNTAHFLPKGYYLILESHHHGTGRVEKEKTKVYFREIQKTPEIKAVHRFDQTNNRFTIPPHEKNYRVDLRTFRVEEDIQILGCQAHGHMRGRELHSWITRPDGKRDRLLTVSSFLYTWHSGASLSFASPKIVPKGSLIESYALIDNSATNPFNADPSRAVRFGQTLDKEEMPRLQCGYVKLK